MRRMCLLGTLAAIGLFAAGCGTLTQNISRDGLTKENMDFINSVPPRETPRVINFDGGSMELSMQRRAWRDFPPVLSFYLKGFGKLEPTDEYYYVRVNSFFCIYLDADATVYNKDGQPRHQESRLWLSCFLFQRRSTTLNVDTEKPEHHWSVKMINIPFTELTMFGWGSDYLQLFFIPVTVPD